MGDVDEGAILSKVWWVGALLSPKQSKLDIMVKFCRIVDFWSCVIMMCDEVRERYTR
jgi:hypothetical protein